jgi:hypothetical protein
MHPNLRTAGTLPSLDMPHHMRTHELCPYREGVTLKSPKSGTEVDVGLAQPYILPDVQIPPKTRVTLRLPTDDSLTAEAVSPATPREQGGYYWGFSVRRCGSLTSVFTETPFDGGYDLSFGTSERGMPLRRITSTASTMRRFRHAVIVFGGVAGLESAGRNDPELEAKGVKGINVAELFDYWVNLVPGQGSRTIRTEEAVWCGLMGLREIIDERRQD